MQLDRTKLLGFRIASSAQATGAKLGTQPDPKGTRTGAKLADIKRIPEPDPKR